MNPKAQSFQDYLDKEKLKDFTPEEISGDDLKPVVFRSHLALKEARLPVVVVWDLSIYGMVRILVAQKALKKTNEAALLKRINETNRKYKAFKYYLDEEGNLVLDACILCLGQKVDGELVYILFNTLGQHLEEAYGQWMKVVWG
ncbi:YbjN domain-containing protein [Acidaminococcus fermentans]|uniref:YbjN domain-containing protein n=1 Tax=Acidaminococcus fermentans TaxID=905 RepID=UPI00243145A2|nr:YbjN domain-containing protein [Acidaminococcus fermentans]MDD6288061.1 hypothetical protein [Acidaminococcus fermentans]